MKLSDFITAHTEEILKEWESFATTLLPAAAEMSQSELRDDAKQILRAIALDLETDQTRREQIKKSKDFMGVPADSAALEHGELRKPAASPWSSSWRSIEHCEQVFFECGRVRGIKDSERQQPASALGVPAVRRCGAPSHQSDPY